MHGRLKIKTSAEQQAEKQKEREKKLLLFQASYKKATAKRESQEFDDEALSIVSGLLLANPDLYTLWNFRKEILLQMRHQRSTDDFQAHCQDEITLTEACLRMNPKSYGAWHHRGWILKIKPEVSWSKEIALCNKFLEIDERNFHCWDHRRSVCHLACVNPMEELDFTMKKIETNFSNYSAWHYRSSLLPLVYPGPKEEYRSILEDVILKEYEHVQNAAFTDPSDQSAWFYHRWLLGRAEKEVEILYIHACPIRQFVTVALTKPILMDKNVTLCFLVNDKAINSQCQNVKKPYPSTLYIYQDLNGSITQNSILKISLHAYGKTSSVELVLNDEVVKWNVLLKKQLYVSELSAAAEQVLQQELESCQQLMELEPNNKWTILTNVLLMRALDNQRYEPEILEHLEKLSIVDASRQNYYKDLRNKFIVENMIENLNPSIDKFYLVGRNISCIPHLDHLSFIRFMDVSNNNLKSLTNFNNLITLEKLNASNNCITSCKGLSKLRYLRDLNLRNNQILNECELEDLKQCKNLTCVNLAQNPVVFLKEKHFVQFPLLDSLSNVITVDDS